MEAIDSDTLRYDDARMMDATAILRDGEDRLLRALDPANPAEHRCVLLRLLRNRVHELDMSVIGGLEGLFREAVEELKRDRARSSLVSLCGQVLASANAVPVDTVTMIAVLIEAGVGAQQLAPVAYPFLPSRWCSR
jgi:hypothetical protein